MNKLTNALLHLNGWVAVLIGIFVILKPIAMLSPYGLQSELSNSLLSELKAPGGLLLVCGLAIVHSAMIPNLRERGLYLSIMVYGSYAAGRLLSIIVDGFPQMEILIALTIEAMLCGLSIAVLRSQNSSPATLALN